jgi:hypothetical protein
MEAAVLPLAFLIVPAALVLAALLGVPRLIEGQRQKAFAAFCFSRGYQYVPERRNATIPYADVVGMFKSGANQGWRDEISGVFNARPFTAFEYQYTTGSGRTRTVLLSRAMIHWRLAGPSLPRFTLVPASTYLFRIGRDPKDVDFPEDTAFSKAYVLSGQDQAAIRDLFTPELRAALTAPPGQFVAAQATDVFWWQERRLPSPEGFDEFLNAGTQVVELFARR